MKTRHKRIISIVLVSIIALIAGLVIASAFIPKNYNFNLSEPESIYIWKTGSQYPISVEYDNEHFDEIISKFNDGFNSNVLSSFFQGKLFSGVKTVDKREDLSNSTLKNGNKIFIEFTYSTAQQTNLHGQDLNISSQEETYNRVVIEIVNSNSLVEVKAMLRYGTDEVRDYGYISYVSYAAHADLYDFINETFTF